MPRVSNQDKFLLKNVIHSDLHFTAAQSYENGAIQILKIV